MITVTLYTIKRDIARSTRSIHIIKNGAHLYKIIMSMPMYAYCILGSKIYNISLTLDQRLVFLLECAQ